MPPASDQARASARIAVVLPDPAGAIATWTRAPEHAIARTRATWPAFSSTPFAAVSSRARSTVAGSTRRPSRRPAASTSRCSAARIRFDVNNSAPATV